MKPGISRPQRGSLPKRPPTLVEYGIEAIFRYPTISWVLGQTAAVLGAVGVMVSLWCLAASPVLQIAAEAWWQQSSKQFSSPLLMASVPTWMIPDSILGMSTCLAVALLGFGVNFLAERANLILYGDR